jgi:hypothetical protein
MSTGEATSYILYKAVIKREKSYRVYHINKEKPEKTLEEIDVLLYNYSV